MGDVVWRDDFSSAGGDGRPAGWSGSCVWVASGPGGSGALRTIDTSATAYASAASPQVAVPANQYLQLAVVAQSSSAGMPTVLVEEVDVAGARVATHWVDCGADPADWAVHAGAFRTSATTTSVRFQLYAAGRQGVDRTGTATFDSLVLRDNTPVVRDAIGAPVPVSDVVDIAEAVPPAEFWARIPPAPTDPATAGRSLWSIPLLRRQCFMVDTALPHRVQTVHGNLDVRSGTLGTTVDVVDPAQRRVVASDIPHRPIVTAHPWTTGTYSPRYYPRRTGDHLLDDFLPATAICSDSALAARRDELLGFMHYSQYQTDGSNGFTQQFYPQWHASATSAGVTRHWAGGWDYLFDWTWPDAYGHTWQLHEPDHHVGSQMAQAMVRAYELTGTQPHLDAAERFVWHQFPRYGFHSGIWQGRTYYWTEYNPTGPDEPNRDATDNVVALCAMAAAMVGHHLGDRRMLAFAKGLLWYCVREWSTDGRWYYDGAENPLNSRKAISHDMVVLDSLLVAVAYLTRSGVEIDAEIDELTAAYEWYLANFTSPAMPSRYGQLAKLPPAPGPAGERLVSYFTANQVASAFTVADGQPLSAGTTAPLTVTAIALVPPALQGQDWGLDSQRSVQQVVTAQQLKDGVAINFHIDPADVVKIVVDHAPVIAGVGPLASAVRFVDGDGTSRAVTARVGPSSMPADVSEQSYGIAATRMNFAIGADLSASIPLT